MTGAIPKSSLLLALVLVVACASGASAVDERSSVNVLTGCRNTTTGAIDQVRPGFLPLGRNCGLGEVKVSWNKTGPQGPQGPAGPAGEQGAPGPAGASNLYMYSRNETRTLFDQGLASFTVYCDPQDFATGGGASVDGPGGRLGASYPTASGLLAGWTAYGAVDTEYVGEQGWQLQIWVLCLRRTTY